MSEVRFDLIRYANCWEDADVLLEGLQAKPGHKILSIASGGDNSLALLATNPELVMAIDLSEAQLHLVELKKIAIREMSNEELWIFLGINKGSNRLLTYHLLRSNLSSPARDFWDGIPEVIANGIVHAGKFEKYFGFFRKWILPFIHSRKKIRGLLEPKSADFQEQFYHSTWNSFAWKTLFRVFFSRFVLGKYGRDPEFLNEVTVPVSEFIFKKAEEELRNPKCQQNYFLRFILLGNFGDSFPFYLRPENLNVIRQNLDCLQLHQGLLQDGFARNHFDRFNLSNIFEYMTDPVFNELATIIYSGANQDARFGYWNLMVPRYLPNACPDFFKADKDLARTLSKVDKGFFYRHFLVDVRI